MVTMTEAGEARRLPGFSEHTAIPVDAQHRDAKSDSTTVQDAVSE